MQLKTLSLKLSLFLKRFKLQRHIQSLLLKYRKTTNIKSKRGCKPQMLTNPSMAKSSSKVTSEGPLRGGSHLMLQSKLNLHMARKQRKLHSMQSADVGGLKGKAPSLERRHRLASSTGEHRTTRYQVKGTLVINKSALCLLIITAS
jgi:hypothetical protein